jgi:protein gp37
MAVTSIEWTNETWNPTTGCDRTSPGCDRCYALTMAKRLKGMGSAKYQTDGDPKTSGPGFGVAMHEAALTEPLRWTKPRRVFVNSMSDLFHADVTDEFIAKVFALMALTPQHTYQLLTKRHGRMRSLLGSQEFVRLVDDHREQTRPGCGDFHWPLPNVWLGVSVEDQKRADLRIPALLDTPAAVRFLSCEPLLGPIDLCGPIVPGRGRPKLTYWLDGRPSWGPDQTDDRGRVFQELAVGPRIDWVIVGGESGAGARPMDSAWVGQIVEQCQHSSTAAFVKQLGSVWARANSASDTKGGKPDDWPADLRVREYPDPA